MLVPFPQEAPSDQFDMDAIFKLSMREYCLCIKCVRCDIPNCTRRRMIRSRLRLNVAFGAIMFFAFGALFGAILLQYLVVSPAAFTLSTRWQTECKLIDISINRSVSIWNYNAWMREANDTMYEKKSINSSLPMSWIPLSLHVDIDAFLSGNRSYVAKNCWYNMLAIFRVLSNICTYRYHIYDPHNVALDWGMPNTYAEYYSLMRGCLSAAIGLIPFALIIYAVAIVLLILFRANGSTRGQTDVNVQLTSTASTTIASDNVDRLNANGRLSPVFAIDPSLGNDDFNPV